MINVFEISTHYYIALEHLSSYEWPIWMNANEKINSRTEEYSLYR
jgi:hypothetical protein